MATAIDSEKWSDKYKDAKCSICAKDYKDEIADHYCYDCNKHMCTSCLGTHNKFNDNHNVVQGLGDSKDVLTEKCEKHPDELITLYCRQDEELLCRKCHHLDHRECQDLQNIRESSDELNADPELQTVPAQLKSALDNINKAIKALDDNISYIQLSRNDFSEQLDEYAEKLLSRIEELRVKVKNKIKNKQEELLAVFTSHRQACAITQDEINQCLDKLTKSKVWKANTFVLKRKGQTIAPKVNALYNESYRLITRHQGFFMTEIKILDSFASFNPLIEKVIKMVPEKKQINVRIPEDKDMCENMGCCHLSDGSLLVADYNNNRLKRVDLSSGMVTKYCVTAGQPTDVCCIDPREVAVAFYGSTQVYGYYAVILHMSLSVEFRHCPSWIAYHDGLLYSAAGWRGDILYINDLIGARKISEISMHTDGLKLFSCIRHIAVDSSSDRVFVADWERGLICVDVDGRRIFHLSEEDLGLSGAYGVTTDHRGHVFICGWNSYNVVKVTKEGDVVGQILSEEDGITWNPQCLSYDERRSQLCVGGDSDQLLIVEL